MKPYDDHYKSVEEFVFTFGRDADNIARAIAWVRERKLDIAMPALIAYRGIQNEAERRLDDYED